MLAWRGKMNQSQIISSLIDRGYSSAIQTKAYTIMTRPVGAEYTGQVVHKDGTIQTLRSVDAVRAINHEEINMSTYYTEKQLNEMTEKERTALFNTATGKNVARTRNKPKTVAAILAAQEDQAPMEDVPPPATTADGKKKSVKLQVREILLHEAGGSSPGVVNAVEYSLAELMEKTGGTKSSVQTALSDLKSDKYAGAGGKLNIVKTKNAGVDSTFVIQP